ncbi:hypothetical protein ACIP97_12525 [Peribacillus frigoritolerans]|uniref:hypothetical protein n=1 Tax=Peribacillus frigoritolerans TaxID=450367 RepID=UPI0037FCE37D
MFLKRNYLRLIGAEVRDSCGSSGTGETPQAFTPRRLTARPAESEHLKGKSTTPHYLVNSNKVCENSLIFKRKKTESNLLTVTLIVYDGRDTYLLSVLYHPL